MASDNQARLWAVTGPERTCFGATFYLSRRHPVGCKRVFNQQNHTVDKLNRRPSLSNCLRLLNKINRSWNIISWINASVKQFSTFLTIIWVRYSPIQYDCLIHFMHFIMKMESCPKHDSLKDYLDVEGLWNKH